MRSFKPTLPYQNLKNFGITRRQTRVRACFSFPLEAGRGLEVPCPLSSPSLPLSVLGSSCGRGRVGECQQPLPHLACVASSAHKRVRAEILAGSRGGAAKSRTRQTTSGRQRAKIEKGGGGVTASSPARAPPNRGVGGGRRRSLGANRRRRWPPGRRRG